MRDSMNEWVSVEKQEYTHTHQVTTRYPSLSFFGADHRTQKSSETNTLRRWMDETECNFRSFTLFIIFHSRAPEKRSCRGKARHTHTKKKGFSFCGGGFCPFCIFYGRPPNKKYTKGFFSILFLEKFSLTKIIIKGGFCTKNILPLEKHVYPR